jgi:DNA-binding beta-propeller fold protein YncE
VAVALAACRGREQPAAEKTGTTSAEDVPSAAAAPPLVEKPRAPVHEGSTIARAPGDDALYVADEDRGLLWKIALPAFSRPPQAIPMPGQPAQVLALADRVLVTIRSEGAVAPGTGNAGQGQAAEKKPALPPSPTGPGLLLVLRPDAEKGLVEEARVPLPQDAWGIGLTPDESMAIVTSAWTHRVSGIELPHRKVRWTVDVPREPRAVVVHPGAKAAYVTHLVGADLSRIDAIDGDAPSVHPIKLPPSPLRTPVGKTLSASLAYSAVLSPDGKRLYVPRHALGALGPQAWLGATTVDVLLTADDTPLAPMRREDVRKTAADATSMLEDPMSGGTAPRLLPAQFVQPRAAVYVKRSNSLLVASEGGDHLTELDADVLDPAMFIRRKHELPSEADGKIKVPRACAAPSGIALSPDEQTAYVFCRSTAAVVVLGLDKPGPHPWIPLGADPLSAEAALGRKLFYNGTDNLVSGGMGCAGCHPEGRDDGHVWHEAGGVSFRDHANFFGSAENVPGWDPAKKAGGGFARQTPHLAGRLIAEGPYGWHAESPHLTHRLINGFALHRWGDSFSDYEARDLYDRAMAIRAFVREGLAPPPHEERPLTDEEKRGQQIFLSEETRCASCHVPAMEYSDRETYAVLGKLPPPAGFDEDDVKEYKTPSLRFVGGTAPYMHDGRFRTLEELVDLNEDRMGRTKQLAKSDRAALVAYLRTL